MTMPGGPAARAGQEPEADRAVSWKAPRRPHPIHGHRHQGSARALTRLLGLWLVLLGLAEAVVALAWRAALRTRSSAGRRSWS
ncbi:hypothetical protein [Streptomyces viridochromogenes]|uniref:hypothetical protein n=1 Tax=Streptomyces viridochromogenes TaxID=1938 RepID=UPI00099BE45E|nr:hypothetical protein [Streptomyces viridochromogenes]